MRVRKWEWIAIAVFLAAALVVPRLEAGPVAVVKFDLWMISAIGNGYASPSTAILAKFISAVLVVSAFVGLLTNRRLWLTWIALVVISGLGYASIQLAPPDLNPVVKRGNELVRSIEAFRSQNGRYPLALSDLKSVPETGLARERRFCYVCRTSPDDDRAHWLPSTRQYLGKADYVICVSLAVRGTLAYRPNGDYSDLPEARRYGDWFHTSRD
jgi:hypothetical protein